jgi:hypothetical protein
MSRVELHVHENENSHRRLDIFIFVLISSFWILKIFSVEIFP